MLYSTQVVPFCIDIHRRLWLNDGSCIRLRPNHKDHVWSYDLMMATTEDGRTFRILTLLDEYTRECLAIRVDRRVTSQDVIDELFVRDGVIVRPVKAGVFSRS